MISKLKDDSSVLSTKSVAASFAQTKVTPDRVNFVVGMDTNEPVIIEYEDDINLQMADEDFNMMISSSAAASMSTRPVSA